jgi:pimeloyl-ACP methyl ester carboxylesterase
MDSADLKTTIRHGHADLSEVRLHYVEAGEGPLVVLLHGFPEFWYAWRLQIPALAAAGLRVVAPDLRGYNLSSKPNGVGAYSSAHLAGDVRDLIAERGASRAHLVGHDWGGETRRGSSSTPR